MATEPRPQASTQAATHDSIDRDSGLAAWIRAIRRGHWLKVETLVTDKSLMATVVLCGACCGAIISFAR